MLQTGEVVTLIVWVRFFWDTL